MGSIVILATDLVGAATPGVSVLAREQRPWSGNRPFAPQHQPLERPSAPRTGIR